MFDCTCIYCLRDASNAQGVEHVIPEGLGNPDWTLPRGTVCDRCNNKLGRKIDMPFVNSGAGAWRSMLAVPGKKGLVKHTLSKGATIDLEGVELPDSFSSGRFVSIQSFNPRWLPQSETRHVTARLRVRLPKPPGAVVSRFLSRLLLAVVAAHLGHEVAVGEALNLHRRNLLEGEIPVRTSPVPGSTGFEPTWAVILMAEGLVLELWGMYRAMIYCDGSSALADDQAQRVLSMVQAPILTTGGPAFWPEEMLRQRTKR